MANEWNEEEKNSFESETQTGFVLIEPEVQREGTAKEQSEVQTTDKHAEQTMEQHTEQTMEQHTEQNFTGANICEQPRETQQSADYQYWNQIAGEQNQQTQYQQTQNQQTQYQQDPTDIPKAEQTRQGGETPKTPKKSGFGKKAVLFVASAAAFGIIAGACFQGVGYVYDLINPRSAESQAVIGGDNADGLIDKANTISSTPVIEGAVSDSDVSAIVENAMPSIVSISSTVSQPYRDFFGNTYDNEVSGSGSGIIIGKNDKELLIATNNHVVAGAKKIKVTCINNDVLTATIKGSDTAADLAVVAVELSDIKPKTMKDIKIAALGDSDKIKVGEKVLAIGNALGYGQSLTVGYVSAKNREVNVDDNKMVLLQTDAAINPGNSGGALINMYGEVIGINSVKYAADAVEGMGYAIPISTATPIFNELMKKVTIKAGDEGYLGIMGRDVTEEVSAMYNMPRGAFVAEVTEGGGAEKAGILSGDIITAVNGIETKDMNSVKEKVNGYPAGAEVTVTVQRSNGSKYVPQDIKVTLQKVPKVSESDNNSKNEDDNTQWLPEEDDNTITIPFGYDYTPAN